MSSVVLTRLLKTYSDGAAAAVAGIDLTIADGELMVLVGPSGCGKSTTLRMIAGLEEISGGTVAIDGRIVNDVPPKDRDIAMVFQNYALYPHLSVCENMAFGLRLRNLPKPEIEKRVREAAEMLELSALLQRRPKELSGGQRQRVAVGRAIVRQPKVFLFDEPLSNLDAKMRTAMRTEITRLHARLKATMIYVTHDQVEAMTMGDRICVMKDGHIQQVATPLTLYREPANTFVAGFIGSPPMNLLRGRIERGGGGLHFLADDTKIPLPVSSANRTALSEGRTVILGVRPEEIQVVDTGAQMTARIEIAEPMGPETYLHLAAGSHRLIARVAPIRDYAAGQDVSIRLGLERAVWFDAVTGEAL